MALTPMMQQYLQVHEQVKDAILFFRLGDFYEMFFDDAIQVSKELDLTLTGKDCGLQERAPMCGVPFHSADNYIAKLIEKGYKVAICEQVEDPKEAKGLVKREITRIVSPGTQIDSRFLDPEKNNFLMALGGDNSKIGCSFLDVSTGDFFTTEFPRRQKKKITGLIDKYTPSEILVHSKLFEDEELIGEIKSTTSAVLEPFEKKFFEKHRTQKRITEQFQIFSVSSIGLEDREWAYRSAGALLFYLDQTQKRQIDHLGKLDYLALDETMNLDSASIRNLELIRTIRTGSKKGSLLGALDKTVTAAGSRLLVSTIESPLLNVEQINDRLDRVEELYEDVQKQEEIRAKLENIYDLERICAKVSFGTIVAADLLSLKQSIKAFGELTELVTQSELKKVKEDLEYADRLEDIYKLIDESLNEDLSEKHSGRIYHFKKGYNVQLDEYRKALEDGNSWLEELAEKEREETGINLLKVKYNKVFGYFLEVPKSKIDLVPKRYIRKQTLVNAERYFTPELKEIEEKITAAEEGFETLENQLFRAIIEEIRNNISRIQKVAKICARLDLACSMAKVAKENNYVRPVVNNGRVIKACDVRHPVVENFVGSSYFIPNDVSLDDDERLMLITGPNMAGKSTYIRQIALLVLLAQIGSFVPASEAEIGIVDRIFTRVGASDDLSTGQSTFMVEMNEVSNILQNATENSLVILDEIGRGTSTYDGISIAWAISEALARRNVKTLFATHYHELTELEEKEPGVVNYSIDVNETKQGVIFLRKIKRGRANQSYGIEVARLAGFPSSVLKRAQTIMSELEERKPRDQQITFFLERDEQPKAMARLRETDPDELSPKEALKLLYELVGLANED